MSESETEAVLVGSCDSWDEVPGSLDRKPESTVRVRLSQLGGGSIDLYLEPGDAISDGQGTFNVEVEALTDE